VVVEPCQQTSKYPICYARVCLARTESTSKAFLDLVGRRNAVSHGRNVHNGRENQQESSGVLALRKLPTETLQDFSSPQKPMNVMQHDQGCIGTLRKLAGRSDDSQRAGCVGMSGSRVAVLRRKFVTVEP